MKKQLLLACAILLSFQVTMGQNKAPGAQKNKLTSKAAVTKNNNGHKAVTVNRNSLPTVATVLYSNDFSDSTTWVSSNQTGTVDTWLFGTAIPSGPFAISGIMSTTASNGAALFDSDLMCTNDQIVDLTTASSFDCSTEANVNLTFEQYYRRYDDSTFVFVSNDNVTWTKFAVNEALLNNDFVAGNPTSTTVDISSVAGNQATVWIRFEFWSPATYTTGPAGAPGCAYAWMIDDVVVESFSPVSLVPFYTNDFSDSTTWTSSNQTGTVDTWVFGTAIPSGTFAIPAILSTSAANGYALFDSDLLCTGNQVADLTTAASINCTTQDTVVLQFEQFYRRFDDSTFVFVSIDGTTWTQFPVNASLTNNDFTSANPTVTQVDISSVAANQATVWIRFEFWSPSTYLTGPAAAPGCGYSWMIDDITLFGNTPVGLHENEFANANVYPSPTSGLVNVDLGTSNFAAATVTVYGISGNQVIEQKINGVQKFELNLAGFEAGMYLVRVQNETSSFVQRVTLVK